MLWGCIDAHGKVSCAARSSEKTRNHCKVSSRSRCPNTPSSCRLHALHRPSSIRPQETSAACQMICTEKHGSEIRPRLHYFGPGSRDPLLPLACRTSHDDMHQQKLTQAQVVQVLAELGTQSISISVHPQRHREYRPPFETPASLRPSSWETRSS